MKVKSIAKNVKGSPRKLRVITKAVSNLTVSEALDTLKYMPKGNAIKVYKVLKTALADAQHNFNLNPDDLYISTIQVGDSTRMKRFRAGSRGKVRGIIKRNSNIMVEITDGKDTSAVVVEDKKTSSKEVKTSSKSKDSDKKVEKNVEESKPEAKSKTKAKTKSVNSKEKK